MAMPINRKRVREPFFAMSNCFRKAGLGESPHDSGSNTVEAADITELGEHVVTGD